MGVSRVVAASADTKKPPIARRLSERFELTY
jgi:hypothetical protein